MTSDAPSTPPASDQSSDPQIERGRWLAWWLRPKVAFPMFILLLILLAPTLIRGYRLSQVPSAPEPFDTQAVLKFIVPDEQNAFVDYRQATASLIALSNRDGEQLGQDLEGEWADVPEAIRRWVEDNRRGIELWTQGSAKPDSQLSRAGDVRLDTIVSLVGDLRTVGRLVQLDERRLRAEGHPDQAWVLLKAGLQAGQHIGRRGVAIERLVGMAIGEMMSEEIVKWAQDPLVTTEILQHASKELDEVLLHRPPISSTLQVEYLYMREMVRLPENHDYIPGLGSSSPIPGWGSLALYAMGEPNVSERSLSHMLRNYLSQVDKPRRNRTKQSGQFNCYAPDSTAASATPTADQVNAWVNQSFACRESMPMFSQLVTAADRVEIRNSLLKTVLALEIYRRLHGTYPETLGALVPNFMPEIPDDIFEPASTPLKYRRDGANALLWSVGQDTVDNAGDIEGGKDMGYLLGPKKPKPESVSENESPGTTK